MTTDRRHLPMLPRGRVGLLRARGARAPVTSPSAIQFAAFSGGKDSTAMTYRLAEMGEDFSLLFTPTGNELAELTEHIGRVVRDLKRPLVTPENKPLSEWIAKWNALPNPYQRWCTRVIKIEPCAAFFASHPRSVLLVGLRADEEERAGGLYGDLVTCRYPLREWGWGLAEVWGYLKAKGVTVPARTDCAVCPFQRLDEWWSLWKNHPDEYARGRKWEQDTGRTFRSPGRDSWPASLAELAAEFERGKEPKAITANRQGELFDGEEPQKCRVCSL